MDRFSYALVQAAVRAFDLPEPVVEMGSRQVGDYPDAWDLRSLFPGKRFIGADFEAGKGVDRIENVERLTFRDGEVGTLIAVNLFEHVWDIRAGFAEAGRVVGPNGVAVVSMPFSVHVHRYPCDFWRATPDAMRRLLAPFPAALVGTAGVPGLPRHVFAVAFKGRAREDVAARRDEFLAAARTGAGRSVGGLRRAWLRVGSWVFGRRYFRPYLQRDAIEGEVVE